MASAQREWHCLQGHQDEGLRQPGLVGGVNILISALSRFTSPTGICRHAANLAHCVAQADKDVHITLVTGVWQARYYREVLGVDEGRQMRILPIAIRNNSIARNRWFIQGLPRLATSISADLVHLSFPVPIVQGWFACKVVVSLHDLYPYDCPEVFGYPNVYFNRIFLQTCLRNSDAIACVSAATYSRALELLPESLSGRMTVIPNCFVPAGGIPARPPNFSFSNFALSVAQHRDNKNLPVAIEGFARLAERRQLPEDCVFIVVGCEGPATEQIQKAIVDRGLTDRVKLISSVPDNELRWLYQHCLFFLSASSTEGFCLPLLEAMAAGCLVVCSDIPAHREIGSSSCHYFQVDDAAEGLAMAVVEAFEEDCAHDDLNRFSSPVIGQQYMSLYHDLLSPVLV